MADRSPARPTVVLVGGFLGAGKTTLIATLTRRLVAEGRTVGVITNDQAEGLVDSELLAPLAAGVEEVAGGCFCCRFDALAEAAERLAERLAPDIVLAEPVGSCTDVVATVVRPLRTLYDRRYEVAPFTVLVDPVRARQVLVERSGGGFSPRVVYIFRTQLEESDLILLNKVDLLAGRERRRLVAALEREFPGRPVLEVSAATGEGLDRWWVTLSGLGPGGMRAVDVDYDTYAEGEAELGWLNARFRLEATAPFDAAQLLRALVDGVRERLVREGREPAHVKALLRAGRRLASAHLTSAESGAVVGRTMEEPVAGGELIVNARVAAPPEAVRAAALEATEGAAAAVGAAIEVLGEAAFAPARPVPRHRIAAPEG